ncbi:hypothetical protein AMS68_007668 [Peltaster fructicola]|uniref:Asparaginase n=1 Tax=Peltaster fructicola TaxID=286661 RepID=A0A6H0Y5E8_9PEZI|nr:hypothetical protein AMS68_007668 [Peltaster fructicola]
MIADKDVHVKPRIIIHGGAGNILRENLPPKSEEAYRQALLDIVNEANALLHEHGATALDVATHAVVQLENNVMFNAGRGAVFTRAGTNELEASVMVSRGSRKRGVGVVRLTKVKNPIKLAREMLLRGESSDGGGAQMHCQIAGEQIEHLAEQWGLDMVKPSYFWTRKRWEEHRRGLGKQYDDTAFQVALKDAELEAEDLPVYTGYEDEKNDVEILVDEVSWNGRDYLPKGTVGAVVMDSTGTICAATSTGGLTNKLPGRIGDTPTLGSGYWCEEWAAPQRGSRLANVLSSAANSILSCFNMVSGSTRPAETGSTKTRAVGMSGTGNGDSFLRTNAVRTAAAIARFSSNAASEVSLAHAVTAVAGPNGLLQQSAGENWRKTGEGEGGIIGIEFNGEIGCGNVVFDYNCGGMFRAWIDGRGNAVAKVFR